MSGAEDVEEDILMPRRTSSNSMTQSCYRQHIAESPGGDCTVYHVCASSGYPLRVEKDIRVSVPKDVVHSMVQNLNELFRVPNEYFLGITKEVSFLKDPDRDGDNWIIRIPTPFMNAGSLAEVQSSVDRAIAQMELSEWAGFMEKYNRFLAHVCFCCLNALNFLESGRGQAIIHKNIKPTNILFGIDGKVVLADSLITRQRRADARASLTGGAQTLSICGDQLYFAPERVLREPYNCKADAWSLGLVIVEAWDRRHPYLRDSEASFHQSDMIEHITDQIAQGVEPLSKDTMPPDMYSCLEDILAFDPWGRLTAGAAIKKHTQAGKWLASRMSQQEASEFLSRITNRMT